MVMSQFYVDETSIRLLPNHLNDYFKLRCTSLKLSQPCRLEQLGQLLASRLARYLLAATPIVLNLRILTGYLD